jgi:hypothetical protein
MARVFLEYLLPVLLPTALYALWLIWQRRRAATAGTAVPAWQEGPWFWLIVAGFALAVLAVVAIALLSGNRPGETYVPPMIKNGKVVPGHFGD